MSTKSSGLAYSFSAFTVIFLIPNLLFTRFSEFMVIGVTRLEVRAVHLGAYGAAVARRVTLTLVIRHVVFVQRALNFV